MTTHETASHVNDPFAFLYAHQFIVLTTYRKDGSGVPTTVWFAHDEQGKIYITTQKQAGKAKRVRSNGRVQMTPSDRTGNLLGQPEVSGKAYEASGAEYDHANAVLKQKYGAQFDQIAGASNAERIYIVVEPEID